MSVLSVEAAIECEGCGKHFRVEVDTGGSIPEGWDMMDIVKDAVAGGRTVAEKGQDILARPYSVQDDEMLCAACTADRDAEAK